ncbi:MAG: hypothetical protein V9E94_18495 [Microthrixaceae bacterium]
MLLLTAVSLLVLDLPGTGPLRPIRNVLASVFSPVRSGADAMLEPFSNGWKGAFGYGELKSENDRLRAELAAVAGQEADIARLTAKVRDLERLNGVIGGRPSAAHRRSGVCSPQQLRPLGGDRPGQWRRGQSRYGGGHHRQRRVRPDQDHQRRPLDRHA